MNQEEKKEYTPEEVKAIKESMMKQWESEIPFLQKQKEYQTLVTEIDELQMRSAYAMRKTADIMAPSPEEEAPKQERKLRKEPV